MHTLIATALAQQRHADLRRQADHRGLARSARVDRRPPQPTVRRWWRLATRPARA